MVSTRNHPSNFPPPTDSPAKSLTRTKRDTGSPSPTESSSSPPTSPSAIPKANSKTPINRKSGAWAHTPSHLVLIWLLISLPLVIWDTGYVLLRPHSMPGGSLHSPIWTPYALYSTVDYIYGFPALEANNGFTAAQGWLNAAETMGYVAYLWIVWNFGVDERKVEGRGAPSWKAVGWLGEARSVKGREAGLAVVLGFAMAVMTISKTVLYWLNEYCSGFDNIGHNDFMSLLFLWIIPNGLWLLFPAYMIYVFGQELLEGLAIASDEPSTKKPLAIKGE